MSTATTAIRIQDFKAFLDRRRVSECLQFRRTARSHNWQRNGRDHKGRSLWKHRASGAAWFEKHLYEQYEKYGIGALEMPF